MDLPSGNGMASRPSPYAVAETVERLAEAFQKAGMTIFTRLDQQAAAKAAGLEMRPMILLIFGNPKAGTPLMLAHPSLALDLPLKALVWEDAAGTTRVSTNTPEYLQQRHGLPEAPFKPVEGLIARVLE